MATASEKPAYGVGRTIRELFRFGIVGVAHNAVGYGAYLLVTFLGLDPKIAVAILYPLGTAVSYFANRHWTFNHQGAVVQSMPRYLTMHVCGYFANILILYVGFDLLGFPHQLVQLFAIFFLALVFFLASKFLIFHASQS